MIQVAFDAEQLGLFFLKPDQGAQFCLVTGCTAGNQLSSELTAFFINMHLMSAFGGHPCYIQATGAAANNHDLFRICGWYECHFLFTAQHWIYQTLDAASFENRLHAGITGDAGADFIQPAFQGLFGHFRVRQQSPADAHQIGFLLPDDVIGDLGLVDSADGHNRHIQGLFYLSGRIRQTGFLHEHRLTDPFRRHIVSSRNLDDINTGSHQHFQDLNAFTCRQAAVDIFFSADLKRNGKIRSHPLSDLHDDFFGKTGSAHHIFSILIFTNVGESRQKLIYQIAVGSVDLKQLKSCLISSAGSIAEFLHQLLDAVNR